MTRQTIYHLIFNAVGVLIGLTIVWYVAYSFIHTDAAPTCSARYPAPTRFSLHTASGAPMSPIELQARAGLGEWGVIDNAKIVAAPKTPTGVALEVKLATVPDAESGSERPANGISFRWSPSGVRTASAVCLNYDVWLADDFAFNDGGLLPGIIGGPSGAAASEPGSKDRFSARPQWRRGGEGELAVAVAGSHYVPVSVKRFSLPKGRWMHVEQELVLNTPGAADGIARLWLDGELKAEDTRATLRKDKGAAIFGVLADIGYVRTSAKPSTLRLTPFELSWK
jgi:Polysaccharide lyase 14